MKKVFISHPYKNDPEGNQRIVFKMLEKLHKKNPDLLFISPLHLFAYMKGENDEQRAAVMEACKHLIDICDEVWIFGLSDGCLEEGAYAVKQNKTVHKFRYDLEEILDVEVGNRCLKK